MRWQAYVPSLCSLGRIAVAPRYRSNGNAIECEHSSRDARQNVGWNYLTAECKAHPRHWLRRASQRPADHATTCGPFQCREVRPLGEKSSWMRVLITVAVDWRFVMALVILALLLLLK